MKHMRSATARKMLVEPRRACNVVCRAGKESNTTRRYPDTTL